MTRFRRRMQVVIGHLLRSLRLDTDHDATIAQVRSDVSLRSGGKWALAFAILIASVGLNVNSTAVIIGAMLISPLMGPIVGAGVALGTSDLALLRTSLRSLVTATGIALLASTVYFALSPLGEAQSELLARTRPTLYDVLIAIFGGSAGIVAATRRGNKSLVVPGVAIATALMPPLCTAGFGLAHLDLWFFLGAMHLFSINALFICLATLAFVRLMRFERSVDTFQQLPSRRRIRVTITVLTMVLALPTIYTAYSVVQESRFKTRARRFVTEHLTFANRTLVNVGLTYGLDSSRIDATLIGPPLSPAALDSIRARMPVEGLRSTKLQVLQPLGQQLLIEQAGAGSRRDELRGLEAGFPKVVSAPISAPTAADSVELAALKREVLPVAELARELGALYPSFRSLSLAREAGIADTSATVPRRVSAVARWQRLPNATELRRVRDFLALRLPDDSVTLSSERAR